MKARLFSLFSVTAALFLILVSTTSCKNYKIVPTANYSQQDHPQAPDYADLSNWAAHPDRDDFADGTPCEEVCDRQGKAMVDVFFLHPTTFYNGDNWNASLTDTALNKKTDETTIKHQASIFNGHARVFAPRYRQTVYGAFFTENKTNMYQSLMLAYSDVARAFEYYLQNENDGRPIIIASHSQGSCHAIQLMRQYFDGKPLSDQLVTAYIVGWPVMQDSFKVLKPCESPGETGCYNSWCTFHWDHYPDIYDEFYKGSVVTNPINWKIDGTYAARSEHKGAVLRKYNKFFPEAIDAQAMDGILWVHPPKNVPLDKKLLYNWKSYHIADYNLFWKNIRDNVRDRAKAFLLNNPEMITGGSLPEDMFGPEEVLMGTSRTKSRRLMKILLVEPFFTGSHRDWALGFQQFSSHDVEILSLPGRHWKWRMHGGAVTLARKFVEGGYQPDLILATDMLDLATFLGLIRSEVPHVPVAVYFHENQLSYPWSPTDEDVKLKRDNHYRFVNYTTALAADRVFFNSHYHKTSFVESLSPFLSAFPDHRELDSIQGIQGKSAVLPLGLDLKRFDAFRFELPATDKILPPLILWNHRWEYDKNPEDFFQCLFHLQNKGLQFEVAVLGEGYKKAPKIFNEAQARLGERILQFGYADSFGAYARWLWQADLLPVTSNQDFFGASAVEAVYCGCFPLLPDRLAFPEHLNNSDLRMHYYSSNGELVEMLESAILNIDEIRSQSRQTQVERYDWRRLAPQYDRKFELMLP